MIVSETTEIFNIDLLRASYMLIDNEEDYNFLIQENDFATTVLPDWNKHNGSIITLDTSEGSYFIFMLRSKSVQVIVHECTHLAHFVMKELNIPVIMENTEIMSYLTDFIYGQLSDHYKIKKKFRKKQ